MMCALHTLKTDENFDRVNWEVAKSGPVFSMRPNLATLDIDNLSQNQLRAVRAAAIMQDQSSASMGVERTRQLFIQINRYLELK